MAIPVIQSRSEQKETSNVATTTITAPSGITNGDVLVICIATDGNSVFSFPSGFIEIDQGFAPSSRAALGVAYKIASGESGNYTVTWTGGDEQAISEMYRIDGAISGDEIQDPGESNTGTSALPTIIPSASTDTDDSFVLVVAGVDRNRVTPGSGGDADYTTEDIDESTNSSAACGIGVQSRGVATAAVPPQCDLTIDASDEWRTMWFAVRSIAPVAAARRIFVVT